jgi:hypothetical protein
VENSDGTGSGITSIGNLRNPYLPSDGASLMTGAGIGLSSGLSNSGIDFKGFVDQFLTPNVAGPHLSDYLAAITSDLGLKGPTAASLPPTKVIDMMANLPVERQAGILLDLFYVALRDAGRDHNDPTSASYQSYDPGFEAIASLFGKLEANGSVLTRARDIRTKNGGNIDVFAPGGGLTMANSTIGDPLIPPGVVTESGGNVSIFTKDSVDLGIGRIFTLRGGNIVIWSSTGDIAAGAASKTVKSAPPARVLIDPQSGDVQTDLAGLATGGGIGVLATVSDVPPGDVDLISPNGVVDAGDAGIRVSGNLNIAATKVLNAGNITVGGKSSGVPSAPVVAAPNIAGLSSGASATGAASNAANDIANQARQQQQQPTGDQNPSIYTVDVLGYGGGDGTSNGTESGASDESSKPEGSPTPEGSSTSAEAQPDSPSLTGATSHS